MDNPVKILKEYKDLIIDNNFEELYNHLDSDETPAVTQLFIDAGVINEVLVNMNIIPDYMFNNCTGLTSITIPAGVTNIGEQAFHNCTKLTNIIIPDSVAKIGIWAFENCTGLTSVTIGDGVRYIGSGAFFRCYRLTSVTIPENVMIIGDAVFANCHDLTNVTIPSKFKNKIRGIFRSKANEINFTFT